MTTGSTFSHDEYWSPRHHYRAAFGAHVALNYLGGPENPQNVEAYLVEKFCDAFGAVPTPNSTWPAPIQPQLGNEDG